MWVTKSSFPPIILAKEWQAGHFTNRVNGGQSIYHARLSDDDDKLVHTAAAGHTASRVTVEGVAESADVTSSLPLRHV